MTAQQQVQVLQVLLLILSLASFALAQRNYQEATEVRNNPITTTTAPQFSTTDQQLAAKLRETTVSARQQQQQQQVQWISPVSGTSTTAEPDEPIVDPTQDDLCIIDAERGAFRVNQTWSEETCERECRCVFRSETRNMELDMQIQLTTNYRGEQTEIRCSIPAKCKIVPTPGCQRLHLALPQIVPQILDVCTCPAFTCVQPISPAETIQPTTLTASPTTQVVTITTTVTTPSTSNAPPTTTSKPTTVTSTPSTTTFFIPTTLTSTTTAQSTTTSSTTSTTPPAQSVTSTSTPAPTTIQSTTSTEQPIVDISTSSSTTTTKFSSNNSDVIKPAIGNIEPCLREPDTNSLENSTPLAWTDQIHSQMNGPIQKYAWHLLYTSILMTTLFVIVLFMYLKKSTHVMPIASQSNYHDNPTFTKFVSYYASQPHVLLVDENKQNYSNDAILAAERKNLELELNQSPPLHLHHHNHHQLNDVHHHHGKQHLI